MGGNRPASRAEGARLAGNGGGRQRDRQQIPRPCSFGCFVPSWESRWFGGLGQGRAVLGVSFLPHGSRDEGRSRVEVEVEVESRSRAQSESQSRLRCNEPISFCRVDGGPLKNQSFQVPSIHPSRRHTHGSAKCWGCAVLGGWLLRLHGPSQASKPPRETHFMQHSTASQHTQTANQSSSRVVSCLFSPAAGPWPMAPAHTPPRNGQVHPGWGLKQHARAARANHAAQITKLQFPSRPTWQMNQGTGTIPCCAPNSTPTGDCPRPRGKERETWEGRGRERDGKCGSTEPGEICRVQRESRESTMSNCTSCFRATHF